ncbi:DUF7147 family protein [Aureibacillus halotolerans]|uniref:DUF7147 domain-containing protein n=1 Tax=Aureibacillus halotolerans TaxID=1508390 RepID=A0A4R6UGN9_9BACI|nr:methylthioribose kinase [Aureibacillus halotolerans]TDQ42304.1 hypothetical protein EV213_102335 [Aureibacillus halotolerans]
MIYKIVPLGEGYTDVHELLEIARTNQHRLRHFVILKAPGEHETAAYSLLLILASAEKSRFQPLYLCREGIPSVDSKRYTSFVRAAEESGFTPLELEVKHSTTFYSQHQYQAYLLSILKLQRLLERDQSIWS